MKTRSQIENDQRVVAGAMTVDTKPKWAEVLKGASLALGLMLTAVSLMYYTVIEGYKADVQRLHELLNQKDKIGCLDSLIYSLERIVNEQDEALKSRDGVRESFPRSAPMRLPWKKDLLSLIGAGERLLQMVPHETATFDSFSCWRANATMILSVMDSKLRTKYMEDFERITRPDFAQFQQLPEKVRSGLSLLRLALYRKDLQNEDHV